MPLYLYGSLLTILQLALLIHVLTTGRPYWWIFVLLFLPGIGSLVYLYQEVWPSFQAGNFEQFFWNLKSPAGKLQTLRERIEDSDTIENQMILAQELLHQKNTAEAVEILRQCASGVFKNDTYVLFALAEALEADGKCEEALQLLGKFKAADPIMGQKMRILSARCLDSLGRESESEPLWEELERHRFSEEASYKLALRAIRSGDNAKAVAKLQEIVTRYRKGNALWRRDQREWFRETKKLLATTKV